LEQGEDQHRNRNAGLALSVQGHIGDLSTALWGDQSFRTRYRARSRWQSWIPGVGVGGSLGGWCFSCGGDPVEATALG
jgi:hypothetical protein